jgi:hypothetical protein
LPEGYQIKRHLGEGGMATVEQLVMSVSSIAPIRRKT